MINIRPLLQVILLVLIPLFCLAGQLAAAQDSYPKTPADYEGPFYPVTKQPDEDNDLIQVKGQAGVAKGDILNLSGVVINSQGDPQEGITVEIWQTDPQGRYKHPGDSTPGERDPNFQYWGKATTGPDGSFFFKTIVPGAYYPRPAHIHYKIWRNNRVILTSQIYFRPESDRTRLPSMTSKIELQTVNLKPVDKGELETFFRIVL
jgi:protocatechuate 3,4-dioxygenase, beta subunit